MSSYEIAGYSGPLEAHLTANERKVAVSSDVLLIGSLPPSELSSLLKKSGDFTEQSTRAYQQVDSDSRLAYEESITACFATDTQADTDAEAAGTAWRQLGEAANQGGSVSAETLNKAFGFEPENNANQADQFTELRGAYEASLRTDTETLERFRAGNRDDNLAYMVRKERQDLTRDIRAAAITSGAIGAPALGFGLDIVNYRNDYLNTATASGYATEVDLPFMAEQPVGEVTAGIGVSLVIAAAAGGLMLKRVAHRRAGKIIDASKRFPASEDLLKGPVTNVLPEEHETLDVSTWLTATYKPRELKQLFQASAAYARKGKEQEPVLQRRADTDEGDYNRLVSMYASMYGRQSSDRLSDDERDDAAKRVAYWLHMDGDVSAEDLDAMHGFSRPGSIDDDDTISTDKQSRERMVESWNVAAASYNKWAGLHNALTTEEEYAQRARYRQSGLSTGMEVGGALVASSALPLGLLWGVLAVHEDTPAVTYQSTEAESAPLAETGDSDTMLLGASLTLAAVGLAIKGSARKVAQYRARRKLAKATSET